MYLAGEASYRPENRILGNDFGRRSCLYPLLLGHIFKKKVLEKKIGVKKLFSTLQKNPTPIFFEEVPFFEDLA